MFLRAARFLAMLITLPLLTPPLRYRRRIRSVSRSPTSRYSGAIGRFLKEVVPCRLGVVWSLPAVNMKEAMSVVSFIKRSAFLTMVPLALVGACSSPGITGGSPQEDHDYWQNTIVRLAGPQSIGLQWSSDGGHILTSRAGATYVVSSDGSSVRRISAGKGNYDVDYVPSFSPDGTRVVYATTRHRRSGFTSPDRNFEIETSRLDGSDKRRLTDNRDMDTSPAWSPDGTRIAFVRIGFQTRTYPPGIYTIAPDGTNERLVVLFNEHLPGRHEWVPVWSPDGKTIAFSLTLLPGSVAEDGTRVAGYQSALYTVGADGWGLRQLFISKDRSETFQGVSTSPVVWSPDGQSIAFKYYINPYYGESTSTDFIIDRNGENLREFQFAGDESPNGSAVFLGWSPDGSRVQVATTSGTYVANVDGSGATKVLDVEWGFAWSPDGSRIAVDGYDYNGSWVIASMAIDGSDVRVLAKPDKEKVLVAGSPK